MTVAVSSITTTSRPRPVTVALTEEEVFEIDPATQFRVIFLAKQIKQIFCVLMPSAVTRATASQYSSC